jgi:hypothetical protein
MVSNMPIEQTGADHAPPRSTRLSLAANYDPELIPALAA